MNYFIYFTSFSFLLHFSFWKIPKQTTIEKDEYFEIIMTAIYRGNPRLVCEHSFLVWKTIHWQSLMNSLSLLHLQKTIPSLPSTTTFWSRFLCFIFFVYTTSKMLCRDEWSNQRLFLRNTTSFDFVFYWPRKWRLTTSCKILETLYLVLD